MDIWSILAIQAVALLGGAITGALALFLGGAGSVRVITTRLNLLEEAVDHTDSRLTKEVKSRAGQVAADKRQRTATVEEQAQEYLESTSGERIPVRGLPRASKRPSVVNR